VRPVPQRPRRLRARPSPAKRGRFDERFTVSGYGRRFTMTALGVIGYQIMATHQVAHAVDRGFQYTTVVWLFAFGAGCMMAGNLLGGWLSDHFGRGWVFAFGSIVAIAGIGCLALMSGPGDLPLLLLYTVSGFGFGMRIAQLSAIPADVFSGPHLGAILGVVQAGGGLGGAIGPFLGGWLFDATGSYQLAFAAASFAIAGSAVAAWIAAPGDPRIDVPSPALSRCGRHARIWVRRVVKHAGRPRR